MDSHIHSEFTGSPAVISNRETGKFTAYDGWIEGKNLKLIPNKKIVQQWRGADWPKGHYSIVEYEFFPIQNGTKLVFSQKDVPAQFYSDISKGWREHYWEKLKAMLEK
jgi:activator of HSP90 ATPase